MYLGDFRTSLFIDGVFPASHFGIISLSIRVSVRVRVDLDRELRGSPVES